MGKIIYISIAGISSIIRHHILPNPFELLGDQFTLPLGELDIPLIPELTNWIADPLLHALTFVLVKLYYKKGQDNSAIGSLWYLFLYGIHIGILHLLCYFNFHMIAIILVVVGYVLMHVGFLWVKSSVTYRKIRC